MEKDFLDNLVLLVKNDSLDWKLLEKDKIDQDGDSHLFCLGPDQKTSLLIKFEGNEVRFIKVTNKELGIGELLFTSKYPEQLKTIGSIIFSKYKVEIDNRNQKGKKSEVDKWDKLTQTFDLQNVRDIKLDTILKK